MSCVPILILLFSSLTALPAQSAASRATPGFAGVWKLDAAQSSSVGGGRGQRDSGGGRGGGLALGPSPDWMAITEDATSVTVEEHRGDATAKVVLSLDGKEVPRVFSAGANAGATAVTVSKWEKNRLTTVMTLASGARGAVQYEEVRYLDLGSLIVEIRQIGSPNSRRTVYVRAK